VTFARLGRTALGRGAPARIELVNQPTRGDLAKAALGIIFCTAIFTTLFVWVMWH